MKDYRELKLIGSMEQQEKLLEAVEQQLKDGWTRDRDKEAKEKSRVDITYKIFVCSQRGSRPAVALFFHVDKNHFFYISTIVPQEETKTWEVNEYNQILEEFYSKFIEPIASNFDVEIITTPAERTIENSMSPELAKCLQRFSNAANKSSGGTHPYDKERFLDFIIQAHQEGSLLDESQLRKLLIDNGWSEENAFRLSCEYRFGMDLLKRYDKK